MVEYDLELVKAYAKRLYSQARATTMRHFFIGIFFGIIIFGGVSDALLGSYDALIVAIGAMIGGVMGYGSGQNRAFELKMQAQQALCQVHIEQNTRKN
ncbi:MAG TPA: hypothetical protein PLD92_08660 [Candidatus Omnitrophota bacterium]|jgi:dipeptide/tripeptide permease|nr:hypothetical protein [Candidatus Omnitrophota bacterium]